MRVQRYFVEPSAWQDNRITIKGDDVHHIVRVMRGQPGDELIVSDGVARVAQVELVETTKDTVVAHVLEDLPMAAEPHVQVFVAQALPKADKMELVVQKGTELGAAGFMPFESARTIVQYDAKKQAKVTERWAKIAKEAAEQAHRDKLPTVESPQSWKQLLARIPRYTATFICYEKQMAGGLRDTLEQLMQSAANDISVMLIVGPEGGFTPQEIEQAVAAGANAITLGKRILRTETAALAALSAMMYAFGEMGG
jgi:16S rRNA (uracil1498-N3)-methyltransferase